MVSYIAELRQSFWSIGMRYTLMHMQGDSTAVLVTVDLMPMKYQSSINAFRVLLEEVSKKVPSFAIAVRTPIDEKIVLQVRRDDAYIVAFKGANGWYSFRGEMGAWGTPCGIGASYSELGMVGKITYDDLKKLGELTRFQPGTPLDKRLVAIIAAVTSEAARFATVATYFTRLTNSVGTTHSPCLQGGVDFEHLKHNYFNKWEKPPEAGSEPGQLHHFTKGEILLPHKR